MYFYIDVVEPMSKELMRFIMTNVNGDSYTSFPLTDDNPNTAAYLAWVAEGNTPLEWTGN